MRKSITRHSLDAACDSVALLLFGGFLHWAIFDSGASIAAKVFTASIFLLICVGGPAASMDKRIREDRESFGWNGDEP